MQRLVLVGLSILFATTAARAQHENQRADSDRVYRTGELDWNPKIRSTPPLTAGVGEESARVVVQAVVDARGYVEWGSETIVETSDSGLDQEAEDFVLAMVFQPGRGRGRAVRTLIAIPVVLPTSRTATC